MAVIGNGWGRIGGRIAITTVGTVTFWDVSISTVKGDVERITLWLQVATGMELAADSGEIRVLDAATWHERRGRLDELGGAPEG